MNLDIHIVSFPRDYAWLNYCIRSIRKFTTGYRHIHVTCPADASPNDPDIFLHPDSPEVRLGYIRHQVAKMRACQHTDADFIAFLDSDHICVKPTPFEHYFDEDRPQLWRRTYKSVRQLRDTAGITAAAAKWQKPAEHALGFECPWFTLEFLPIVHPRDVLLACLDHVEQQHGRLEEYANMTPYPGFGDFLVMGSFALEKYADRYSIRDPQPDYDFRFHGYSPYQGLPAGLARDFEYLLA